MADRFFDIRFFRYALASAEHGSFRRAAAALNVDQSTLSRGVRSLEHRVGAELFERSHAGIRPTLAGNRFLEEAGLGFEHLRCALQRVGAFQRGEHGELTVGVSMPFILMGDAFERFRDEYRGVSVEIIEGAASVSWASVQQRTVDVAFVANVRGSGAVQSLHLRDERMIAVLPKAHPLAAARGLDLKVLRHERFILSASGVGPDMERHLKRRMGELGIEPRIQLHRASLCDLLAMVAKGYGITIVVGPLSRAAPDDIVLIPLAGRNVISVSAIWIESNPNPALKGLLDILRTLIRPGPRTDRSLPQLPLGKPP